MAQLADGLYYILRWDCYLSLDRLSGSDFVTAVEICDARSRPEMQWIVTNTRSGYVTIKNKHDPELYLTFDPDEPPEEYSTVLALRSRRKWYLRQYTSPETREENRYHIILPDGPTRLVVHYPEWGRSKVVLSTLDLSSEQQTWMFQPVR